VKGSHPSAGSNPVLSARFLNTRCKLLQCNFLRRVFCACPSHWDKHWGKRAGKRDRPFCPHGPVERTKPGPKSASTRYSPRCPPSRTPSYKTKHTTQYFSAAAILRIGQGSQSFAFAGFHLPVAGAGIPEGAGNPDGQAKRLAGLLWRHCEGLRKQKSVGSHGRFRARSQSPLRASETPLPAA
jgi:hypothetical protein